MTLLALDLLGILLGMWIFGRKFAIQSLFAAVSFAAFFRLYELFPPILPSFASLPLLAALLGGILLGSGEGILIQNRVASGFDSSLALVMEKRLSIPVSLWYIVTDTLILLASATYLPLRRLLYTLCTILVSNGTIALFGIRLKPLQAHGSSLFSLLFTPLRELEMIWEQKIPTLYWHKDQSMASLLWTVEPLTDSLP